VRPAFEPHFSKIPETSGTLRLTEFCPSPVTGQKPALTPYLTTVGAGTRGISGFKSVEKYLIPSRKRGKTPQITTKNLVQAFGIFVQEKRTHSEKIIESPLKT